MLPSPILTGTSEHIGRWIDTTKSQLVSNEEKAIIDSGTPEGRKLFLLILFTRSFLALGCSFHATLRDYCSRIIGKNLGIHEAQPVSLFLLFTLTYVPELFEHDIIDPELAALTADPAVGAFLHRFGN